MIALSSFVRVFMRCGRPETGTGVWDERVSYAELMRVLRDEVAASKSTN